MKYYAVLNNFGSVYVKEGEFFRAQGGNKHNWGKDWKRIRACSIEHARTKARRKDG